MARTTSVSLTDHFADFIDEQVEQGSYDSPSDVVRAGLELLQERQAKVRLLVAALKKGEESGPSIPFDRDEFLAELQARPVKAGT